MLKIEELQAMIAAYESPQQIADAVGVHVNTVRNIRDGKHAPRYDLAQKIFDFLEAQKNGRAA